MIPMSAETLRFPIILRFFPSVIHNYILVLLHIEHSYGFNEPTFCMLFQRYSPIRN